MSTNAGNPAAGGQWLGQPKGLFTLFFTELWERFSYYGMRALLVLFMTAAVVEGGGGGFGFDDVTAAAIYGIYTAGVYLMALPGGWMADRLLGQQKAVWYGGIIIASGHFTMALPLVNDWFGPFPEDFRLGLEQTSFFAGMLLIVLGTGLLKPNVSAIVGGIYPEGGARRDAGFTIFYMGINLGAILGPLICGWLGENVNWHYGFGAAGIGMVLGLIQYRAMQPHLGDAGAYPHHKSGAESDPAEDKRNWTYVWVGTAAIALVALLGFTGVISFNAQAIAENSTYVIVGAAGAFFAYVLMFGGLTTEEKKRVLVIITLFLGAAIFWSGFEQAGSSFNLFAERFTQREFFGWEHPASWYQSLNPAYIIIFAPFFSWFWVALAKRNMEPSIPWKFAIAMFQLGLGFLVMFGAATLLVTSDQETVLPTWLLLTYLLHTTAELCLSPVALSAVTKLAPTRYTSQMMAMWFVGTALGNLVAGLIAGFLATGEGQAESLETMPDKFLMLFWIFLACGVAYAVFAKPIKGWIGNIK
ncbi:MAG: peptide MFS transporter [Gammaproteobacteria bacterium]|nr:peptide MFS transporter [Gammaproteobacteria bacterium]